MAKSIKISDYANKLRNKLASFKEETKTKSALQPYNDHDL